MANMPRKNNSAFTANPMPGQSNRAGGGQFNPGNVGQGAPRDLAIKSMQPSMPMGRTAMMPKSGPMPGSIPGQSIPRVPAGGPQMPQTHFSGVAPLGEGALAPIQTEQQKLYGQQQAPMASQQQSQGYQNPYQGMADPLLNMDLGGDQSVYDQQKAAMQAEVSSDFANQQYQLAQQMAARGMGAGGGFMTQYGNLANAESMAKAKIAAQMDFQRNMATLQDKWNTLQAMKGFGDQYTQKMIADQEAALQAEAMELQKAQFEWQKPLDVVAASGWLQDAGIDPAKSMDRWQSMMDRYGTWAY